MLLVIWYPLKVPGVGHDSSLMGIGLAFIRNNKPLITGRSPKPVQPRIYRGRGPTISATSEGMRLKCYAHAVGYRGR